MNATIPSMNRFVSSDHPLHPFLGYVVSVDAIVLRVEYEDRHTKSVNPGRTFKCLVRGFINEVFIDHFWVAGVGRLLGVQAGDRILFTPTLSTYTDSCGMHKYCVKFPYKRVKVHDVCDPTVLLRKSDLQKRWKMQQERTESRRV